MDTQPLFLGLDLSTQSLKAIAITSGFQTAAEFSVNFDSDLPAFRTHGGVHRSADGLTVTSPPVMWLAAMDLLLDRMKQAGFPFHRVVALSGSGQQHGSVFLKPGRQERLARLDATRPLADQLKDIFSVSHSPVWMDSSTTAQCRALEQALGGPQAVADLTGSRAFERFTANQIAKIHQTRPADYNNSERITLVSAFAASLFIGDYAPIDVSDGSGMNLMDLRNRCWATPALQATAPGLGDKLSPLCASHAVVGTIHRYFSTRYGFPADCLVIAFSGDNPCSFAGLRLQNPGDVAISLGTSDTLFGALTQPAPSATEGHVFASPIDPNGYMAMIVYKNGSLTREDVRDRCARGSWQEFNAALERTVPGNGGHIGFFFKDPEITPPVLTPGIHRFGPDAKRMTAFPADHEVRAVVEGQMLSMRLHSSHVGIRPCSVLATGGASVNQGILKIMADVFGCAVHTANQPNSAAFGAAYRALHGWTCSTRKRFIPFAEVMRDAPPFAAAITPDPENHALYSRMLPLYEEREKSVLDS